MLKVRDPEDLFVVTGPVGFECPVGQHLEVPDAQGSFDLQSLLQVLQANGLHSLFVEAGPYTVSQFLRARLCDRLYLFVAPVLIGEGLSWTTGFSFSSLDQTIAIENSRSESFGPDILVTGRPLTRFS